MTPASARPGVSGGGAKSRQNRIRRDKISCQKPGAHTLLEIQVAGDLHGLWERKAHDIASWLLRLLPSAPVGSATAA